MKNYLLFILILCANVCLGQLNCKTSKNDKNESVKTCFHKNGKVSTEETWDSTKRSGFIRAYSNVGKELFYHDLRNYGGHASVHLEYYASGQLSKVYFSDAPDGGIQYYNSTTRFDETGTQTEFQETKYPFELEDLVVPQEPKEKPKQEKVEEKPKQEVVECAAIFSTVYQIQNLTNSRLKILIKALPNNAVVGTEKEVVLKPFESLAFDTVLMADQFISAKVYQPEILKIETKSRKNKKIKVTEFNPVEEGVTHTHYWFFVKEEGSNP